MYCWKCGTKAEDGALFCVKCGASLQQHQQAAPKEEKPIAQAQMADRPAAQQPAPQKKGGFKRIVISACIVGIMYLIGSYVGQQMGGAAKQGSSGNPPAASAPAANQKLKDSISGALTDVLTRNAVLVDHPNAKFRRYQVLSYGNDTHRLKAWSIVLVGAKSEGYTPGNLLQYYKLEEMPSFTVTRQYDDADYAVAAYDLNDLENIERIRELIKFDLLAPMPESEIAKGAVDADSLISSMEKSGFTEASLLDYPLLHMRKD